MQGKFLVEMFNVIRKIHHHSLYVAFGSFILPLNS